nr:c-type cytochrome [Saprospiraceae bacterium]
MRNILLYFICTVFIFSSCKRAGGDHPGLEYVPDMVHSVSYEANYYNYYGLNTWGGEAEYYQFVLPRKPVDGSIPLGAVGMSMAGEEEADEIRNRLQGISMSGSVPYYYENTEEDRQRAMDEITQNPFPITKAGLAKGKNLYDIYCGICHGSTGDGNGFLVREDGGVYPAQPTSFLTQELVGASEGRFYHSIMHGRNVMGPYNDKLSFEERWQVIHYIRSLQAEEFELAYNEEENTLSEFSINGVEAVEE